MALSLWLSSCGMHKIGSITLNNIGEKLKLCHDASLLQWHCKGKRICSAVNGEIVIIKVVWVQSKNNNVDVGFPSVALTDEGFDKDGVAVLPRCHLSITSRRHLHATSISFCDIDTTLLIGCSGGCIKTINWECEVLSEIMVPWDHSLFRIGESLQLHFSDNESCTCNNEIFLSQDGSKRIGDNIHDHQTHASFRDAIFLCGYSTRLRLAVGHVADGSMVFMHIGDDSNAISTRIVPIIRDVTAGSHRAEEIVSKIYTVKLVDCPTVCCVNDCLVATISITRHFDEAIKSNGNFRQSISLMMTRVTRVNNQNTGSESSLDLSCYSKTDVIQDMGKNEFPDSCIHALLINVESEPLLMISTSSFITCRSIRNCEVEIINISFSNLSLLHVFNTQAP